MPLRPIKVSPATAILAIAVLAGLLYFQRGENDQLKEAERQAVNAYRGARAQTDDAFRLVGAYRDSLHRQGRRVDTVLRSISNVADTIRLRAADSAHPDSVVIAKFEMFAWADKIDKAVNEVSRYRVQVDSLVKLQLNLEALLIKERATTDSLLAIKDLRIKAERKQGRKEGLVVGGVITGVLTLLILK